MELTELGYFSKTHGVKGQLVLKTDLDFNSEELQAVFIQLGGSKAPHFISELKEAGNGIVIGLEEFDTVEKARALVGKKVFIEARFIEESEAEFDWLGYEVIDHRYGSLGEILSTSDNGEQTLITLQFKGREILLPLVDDFIGTIDEEGRKLHYNSPEGLIDLYLTDDEPETDSE